MGGGGVFAKDAKERSVWELVRRRARCGVSCRWSQSTGEGQQHHLIAQEPQKLSLQQFSWATHRLRAACRLHKTAIELPSSDATRCGVVVAATTRFPLPDVDRKARYEMPEHGQRPSRRHVFEPKCTLCRRLDYTLSRVASAQTMILERDFSACIIRYSMSLGIMWVWSPTLLASSLRFPAANIKSLLETTTPHQRRTYLLL